MTDRQEDHTTQAAVAPVPAVAPVFTLVVADEGSSVAPFKITQDDGRVLVGKGPACTLQLTDARVSRRHAALEVMADGLRVTDLGSRNGTFVGRVRVWDALLRGGESLTVGGTTLRVSRGTPEPTSVPIADRFGKLIGASPRMRRLYPLCAKLAASALPVVIEGETGTGKEVLAESLHAMGPRSKGPFVVFDCTTIAPNLLEAALFGHEKSAFTGATLARTGVFEEADGGTLFIDEIGDLDLALQAKLLRAIQKSEIQRIGARAWTAVDVRVVAATRRDLDKEVAAGRFRDDLFFRLAVTRLELPALRDRREDVEPLARHFWKAHGGDDAAFPADLLGRYEGHPWPGNVRELENVVARALVLGDMDPSALGELPPAPVPAGVDFLEHVLAQSLPLSDARERVLCEFERRYLARTLAAHGGSVARAAEAAGVARRYFRLLKARAAR